MFQEVIRMKFKQFAALPYRMRDDDVEILLITIRKKRRWSVPKGWPVKSRTPQQTAAVRLTKKPAYAAWWAQSMLANSESEGLRISGRCFAMSEFFHSKSRFNRLIGLKSRKDAAIWVSHREAAKLVKKPGLRRAIRDFSSPRQGALDFSPRRIHRTPSLCPLRASARQHKGSSSQVGA
jgi:hypothetical protein